MYLKRSRLAEGLDKWEPHPRWPSEEGGDHRTRSDAHMHDDVAAGPLVTSPTLYKALGPTEPRRPDTPAPSPDSGATYHYHPETGHATYGEHPPSSQARQPMLHDHVIIAPKDNPAGSRLHGRVIGQIRGGIHVRYASGETEHLTGDQSHRGMQLGPASYHYHELPQTAHAPFLRTASAGEAGVDHHADARQWRQEMRQGPRVGMRFRDLHADPDARHPYGPVQEIVHIHASGHAVLREEDKDGNTERLSEADPHTLSRAIRHDALRPEEPNYGDRRGEHGRYREALAPISGGLMRPYERPTSRDTAHPDPPSAGYDDARHREAAGLLPGGERVHNEELRQRINRTLGGPHGLADLLDAYGHRHGDLESVPHTVAAHKNGKIEVLGSVHHLAGDGDRTEVGHFMRHLERDKKGNLMATHSSLALDDAHQGHGFALGFNDNAERHYQKWGAHAIRLHANITVGGYAWARQGWDFSNDAHRKEMWDTFKRWADAHGHTFPKRDYDRLRKSGHAWEMADYDPAGETHHVRRWDIDKKNQVDGHFHLGKAFLLQHPWNGTKDLRPGSPHQRQAQKIRDERARKNLQKALAVKEPGKRGGSYYLNGRGRLRYGRPPEAAPPPPEGDTPRPKLVPPDIKDVPHAARFGRHSPEATILHLRQILLYGDQIVRIAYRYHHYAAQVADRTITPREAARRACRMLDGGDFDRTVKALRQLGHLAEWDSHQARKRELDHNEWPKVLPRSSPFVAGAMAAGFPADAAAILGGVALRFAAWGDSGALEEDDAHNDVAKRLLTRPEAEGDIAKSQPLLVKATLGSVMAPGSRGGHVYWKNGKLRYGNPVPPSPRARAAGGLAGNPQWAAPGDTAVRIMRIGHRILYRNGDGEREWGKIISAFNEVLSVLPDNAEEYDLLHTVCVPVEKVVRVVPEGESDEEGYRVELQRPPDELQKSFELSPWPALE